MVAFVPARVLSSLPFPLKEVKARPHNNTKRINRFTDILKKIKEGNKITDNNDHLCCMGGGSYAQEGVEKMEGKKKRASF